MCNYPVSDRKGKKIHISLMIVFMGPLIKVTIGNSSQYSRKKVGTFLCVRQGDSPNQLLQRAFCILMGVFSEKIPEWDPKAADTGWAG